VKENAPGSSPKTAGGRVGYAKAWLRLRLIGDSRFGPSLLLPTGTHECLVEFSVEPPSIATPSIGSRPILRTAAAVITSRCRIQSELESLDPLDRGEWVSAHIDDLPDDPSRPRLPRLGRQVRPTRVYASAFLD
jgi:hypothetical protein